jgi:Cd2+/Zn2+-exporting ATPase
MADIAETQEALFVIPSMDCAAEETLIRIKLEALPGVVELHFNLMQRELTVEHWLRDDAAIENALKELDMAPRRKTGFSAGGPIEPAVATRTKMLVGISGAAALAAEIAGWAGASEQSLMVIGLAVVAIVTAGTQTARKGWVALRTATLNINFLMTIAVAGAVAIGEWPEAAMVTFLFALSELIEAYSLDRARNAIRGLMEMTPETAFVKDGEGDFIEGPASLVMLGAIVRVKPGARVPLDGKVINGQSTVNQAPITGESMPVEKKPGDAVFAGTINERGLLDIEVTATSGETTLDRIIRSVQSAQSERAPTQRFVDQFALYYTPTVVVLAVLIALVPPLLMGGGFLPWVYRALVTLVIACPCALVVSTPVTVVSGLAAAARRGILIKGGVYLEEGKRLKALALDKTGTLTHGRPEVTDIVPLKGGDEKKLLSLAAAIDAQSDHPVATAIVRKAQETAPGERLPEVMGFLSLTGRGAQGVLEGLLYYVGNHRLMEERGLCKPEVEAVLQRLEAEGKTNVVLANAREALAVFGVADAVRATSKEAVRALQKSGVRCVILTGDNEATARAIAGEVGIEDVRGNLLPEDKLAAIEDLRKKVGPVGMVGDGVNDAPALAKANVGFAMGAAGTDTALETADVALMEDDLRRIPLFLALSRQVGAVLRQNITLAIGIKMIFLALNFAGLATLWMAVFADLGASLIVVANGLRLLRFDGGHTKN